MENKQVNISDVRNLSIKDIDTLIAQLESAMNDFIAFGMYDKVVKLNKLIGQVIDIRISK